MFKYVVTTLIILINTVVFSQTIQLNQANWQQRVDYNIQVTLRDSQNMLSGFETITYHNNSPNVLTEIYIHLWPNAYLNNQTPFAKQQVENGKTDFYFAPDSLRGKLDSINFKVNGKSVKTEFVTGYEIIKLLLDSGVQPNTSIKITTPFRVKLPRVFSRLGEENFLYCLTQWYPKPAVYDVNGWNPMPYLDQGEFYSEFGKFVVDITTPKNYVVTATGQIQQQEETLWWQKRTDGNLIPHPSKNKTKTLQFVQDSVHDFAWFASAKFKVSKAETILKSGRKIDTWLFSEKDDNKVRAKGVDYINEAIQFYSDNLGEYPYQQASAVITELKAGGGMEYPTITNVTEVNKQIIVHEVGHNWFYGILASNEREYPWMDESLNSYYESRNDYQAKPVLYKNLFAKKPNTSRFNIGSNSFASSSFGLLQLQYLLSARNNADQLITLPSKAYTGLNYGSIIYGKAPLAFLQLEKYLGTPTFDSMMKSYYQNWKFKHPLPNDFINHVKGFTDKDLTWFFKDLMNTVAKPDYAITRVQKRNNNLIITIRNKGFVAAPFYIQTLNNDSVLHQIAVAPFNETTTVTMPASNATQVRIDALEESIDAYRDNNYARTTGLFRTTRGIETKFLVNIEKPNKQQLFYTPIIGANYYNKTMVGLALYNSILPRKKTEYYFTPMYAFGTKDLAGYFSLQTRAFGYGFIREALVGFDMARFASAGYNSNQVIGVDTLGQPILGFEYGLKVYEKLTPRITIFFKNNTPTNGVEKRMDIRYVMVNEQKHTTTLFNNFRTHYAYFDVTYTHSKNLKINPYSIAFNYQNANAQSKFEKVTAEYNAFFNYGEKKKGLTVRGFAGLFLTRPTNNMDERAQFRLAENNGYFDYLYDHSQFGRGEANITNNIFTQQIMNTGTGFRTYAPVANTDDWVAAINLTSTIFGVLPLRVFVDVAAINTKLPVLNGNTGVTEIIYQANLHYVTGISLWMFKGIFQVNFPVFTDPLTQASWDLNNSVGQRMTFTLNLNALNPIKQIRNSKLF